MPKVAEEVKVPTGHLGTVGDDYEEFVEEKPKPTITEQLKVLDEELKKREDEVNSKKHVPEK